MSGVEACIGGTAALAAVGLETVRGTRTVSCSSPALCSRSPCHRSATPLERGRDRTGERAGDGERDLDGELVGERLEDLTRAGKCAGGFDGGGLL